MTDQLPILPPPPLTRRVDTPQVIMEVLQVFPTVVVIPTHPARGDVNGPGLLHRAVQSVHAQTVKPLGLAMALDLHSEGAGPTRQRALDLALDPICNRADHGWDAADVQFVSFLDSDDFWYPRHLETHRRLLCGDDPTTDADLADVAYSWFDGNGIAKEWEKTHRGKVWDPAAPHHITMTITVRAAFARQASFLLPDGELHPEWTGEDWKFILELNEAGARFAGTGDVTWHYAVHGGNTSGSARRGDAVTPC
jgi:hypothetical protein